MAPASCLMPCAQVSTIVDLADYAVQLESKLKALSLSTDAAKWVMKAMDPVRGGPSQIPDAIQIPTLAPEYKVSQVLNAPGVSNWDCMIITPPSDRVAFYYATGASGIDFSTTLGIATGYAENNAALTGATLSSASCNTTSGAWVSGLSPSSVTAVSNELPAMWRTAARSLTVYATGSELYNQGTVYAGQYARSAVPTCAQAISTTPPTVLNLDVVALPLAEQDMAVMTPGFYTASAKEGVYSVHRLTGPAQEFVTPTAPQKWRSADGTWMNFSLSDPTNVNPQTLHVPRFLMDNHNSVSPVLPIGGMSWASSGFDNGCTWGVTIFRGLHPQMSLTVKTVTALELVPSVAAPSRQFIKPPMRYEPTAIAAYYALASELPSCMGSKHNFLGSILPILSSVASKVLPFLAPMLGQGISSLANAATSRLGRIAAPATPAPTPRPALRSSSMRSRRTASASSRGSRRVTIKKGRKKRK